MCTLHWILWLKQLLRAFSVDASSRRSNILFQYWALVIGSYSRHSFKIPLLGSQDRDHNLFTDSVVPSFIGEFLKLLVVLRELSFVLGIRLSEGGFCVSGPSDANIVEKPMRHIFISNNILFVTKQVAISTYNFVLLTLVHSQQRIFVCGSDVNTPIILQRCIGRIDNSL